MTQTATDPFAATSTEDDDAQGAGKLFEVPRVGILTDDSDPTVLKIAFSGGLELDRSVAADANFYNSLKAGQTVTMTVEVHVAGAKTTHRRDSEGDVVAVVQTKSLIVHSLDQPDA